MKSLVLNLRSQKARSLRDSQLARWSSMWWCIAEEVLHSPPHFFPLRNYGEPFCGCFQGHSINEFLRISVTVEVSHHDVLMRVHWSLHHRAQPWIQSSSHWLRYDWKFYQNLMDLIWQRWYSCLIMSSEQVEQFLIVTASVMIAKYQSSES